MRYEQDVCPMLTADVAGAAAGAGVGGRELERLVLAPPARL